MQREELQSKPVGLEEAKREHTTDQNMGTEIIIHGARAPENERKAHAEGKLHRLLIQPRARRGWACNGVLF